MFTYETKKIVTNLIFVIFIIGCSQSNKVNESTCYNTESFFIIDYNINVYTDEKSPEIIQLLCYFDPIKFLNYGSMDSGRIRVQLKNGVEGWVDEKYTSVIPKDWGKISFDTDFFCYMMTNEKIKFSKQDEYPSHKGYLYANSKFKIHMGVVYLQNYQKDLRNRQNEIKSEIEGGKDKNNNWNKEFVYGKYKINYMISTFHPDGLIYESFHFINQNEMDKRKYFFVSIEYNPLVSNETILIQRKMLFSVLRSLQ